MRQRLRSAAAAGVAALSAACAAGPLSSDPEVYAPPPAAEPSPTPAVGLAPGVPGGDPAMPPRVAMLAGLLPLSSIGIDTFRLRYPRYDGRGVIIGILDSGVDPGLPGLLRTTHGRPKLLDLRDFSGEGRVRLERVRVGRDDTVRVAGRTLTGFGRVARLASGPYYAGLFRERALGSGPAADVNGNGASDDAFPVLVAKASGGWVVVTDTDGDDALNDERPVRDFAVAAETFTYRAAPNATVPGPMTVAVNLADDDGAPVLDFFFDNSSHGTHVAGIAAGHDMFGVAGFDGVAPGAQLLGLKISNNGRGAVSVTGSMVRAMNYAADYAARRNMPLVLNLSFGVGNEIEGSAAIDSIVNEFTLKHPDVPFVISAGNDGPGLSTVWFPGSAEFALSVCALFPGVFAEPPEPGVPSPNDVVGWWSARGGEVAKPDLCAPGVAFSNVPRWRTGEEISIGTSMAAPQIAGAAAALLSAMRARGLKVRAIDIARALTNTAVVPAGATRLDVGAGVPNVVAAYLWLLATHQAGVYSVRALGDGGNGSGATAAFRRTELRSPADTVQRFLVTSMSGQPAARLLLEPDVDWIRAPSAIDLLGEPAVIELTYVPSKMREPGAYVGTVWARAASDTFAGPSFGMTNTVIVPHALTAPFRGRDRLGPGQIRRYFFAVPSDAGGLSVRLRVTDPAQEGTLYLFEPNGQPQRDGGNVAVGGSEADVGVIHVGIHDLVPGVYEAVVVAPPTRRLTYELTAALPEVAVLAIADGPSGVVRNTSANSVVASASAAVVGVLRRVPLFGTGSTPEAVRVRAPEWASEIVIDVQLPVGSWHAVSDFAVTAFDSAGVKVGDGPLRYAFDRQRIALDSLTAGQDITVELFPAFAHLTGEATWSAGVRIAFLTDDPQPLVTADSSATGELRLAPGATGTVSFAPVPPPFEPPSGYEALIEIVARTAAGQSVRRGWTAATESSP